VTGFVRANGIEICYERFGDPTDPTLLLVMGLGVQMTEWDPEFCEEFVRSGFNVIRYDNRDVGRSTWFDRVSPDLDAAAHGDFSEAAYTLFDMAADGIGLLDALGVDKAHVVGASMGGMIAQTMAVRAPDRVASLCSIMSSTGDRSVGRATRELVTAMAASSPKGRDAVVSMAVEFGRLVAGGGYPFDAAAARRRAAAAYDRAHHPTGRLRQRIAILAMGDRSDELRLLRVPTVVVHGTDDPLIGFSGGRATADAIPGAELIVIDGMGHEIPKAARARIIEAVVRNSLRAYSN
jgi:pimeloyl-ACP methyl ester carboxylesterase